MATGRSSRVLLVVLVLWTVFGSWALFSSGAGDVSGLEPEVGHVVVFFFVSLAAFGLSTRRFGVGKGLAVGTLGIAAAAGISEWLQPVLTDTRLAQRTDLVANGVGIAVAVVASLVLIRVLRDERIRAWVVVVTCLVGLGASVAIAFGAAEGPPIMWARVTWECRDDGYERLEDLPGEPIVVADETIVRVGASRSGAPAEDRPLADGTVADDSTDLRCSVLRGGGYTVVATVVPASIESSGPTRIFTSSAGIDFGQQNTHLGQEFDALSVRVRTDEEFSWQRVPEVFEAGEEVTVGVAVADGRAVVFADGEQLEVLELDGDTYFDWDPAVPVLIGDEFSRDRTFEGDIVRVAVFDRALEAGDPALQPAD